MKEADWKRFRKLVPDLRERYLQKKNQELKAMLEAPGKTETERFWDTSEEIRKEEKILCRCLDGHRRSRMFDFMLSMLRHGLLTDSDLEDFSPELRDGLLSLSQELNLPNQSVETTSDSAPR